MGQKESFCLQKTELQEALIWVEANQSTIPLAVYRVVLLVSQLSSQLAVTKERAFNLLAQFRKAIGVEPGSERGEKAADAEKDSKPAKTDAEKLAALKARRKKLLAEIRRYEDRLGKCRKTRQKKLTELLSQTSRSGESEKPEPTFQRSAETVFTGNLAQATEEARPLKVDRLEKFENPRGLHAVSDDRTRYEYGVMTKTIHLKVETVTDPRTGKSVTASTDEIGPPNSQATWAAIANTIIAVIGYAIPINRLALMLEASCPYFTSSRICFYLKMSAELFQPVYNCLGEDQLPECDVLQGDDTKVRVIEIQKRLKNGETLDEPVEGSLIAKVAKAFGRVFDKKRGTGKKRSLNVSVVIGKTRAEDPRSYIFFFRSHLGTFGDLLTKMLETRHPKRKQLTILTDLATTNLVSKELYEKFEITIPSR